MAPWATIMAGGSGTRFWPRSRKARPKQLLALTGKRTLLEATVERILPLVERERIVVVTNVAHAPQVRQVLPWLAPANLLIEPLGRSTGPALILAAIRIQARDPEAVQLALPSDHVILDEETFRAAAAAAAAAADESRLLTFGVVPRYPETGYGYLELGEPLGTSLGATVFKVARFREKPDRATAQRFLSAGNFLWNSGIFAWQVHAFLTAARLHLAAVVEALEPYAAVPADELESGLVFRYPSLPEVSVDVGVLEKAGTVACLRADFGWSDVGSWSALAEVLPADPNGNVSRGELLALASRANIVDTPDKLVALLGVEDLVIVDTPDALLVCAKDRAQDVRQILEALRARGRTDLL